MVGDNSLVESLRVMVSIEIFLNTNFYCNHPSFHSIFATHKEKVCNSINNLLPMSVSFDSLDSGLSGEELVRVEAISNCNDKKFASFLCILGLSSVTNRNITLFYPDCGGLRFKLLFNQQVHPRLPLATVSDDLHILFSFQGTVTAGEILKPNHFVPIVFGVTGGKRKLPQAASQQIRKRSCNVAPVRGTGKDVPTKISSFFLPVSTVEAESNTGNKVILPGTSSSVQ